MKGTINLRNIMNIIMKLLAIGIALSFTIAVVTSCDSTRGAKPMLKVKTSISWGMFPGSTDNYYIVYENGVAKKTSEFVPSQNGIYNYSTNDIEEGVDVLNIIDSSTPQSKEINKIAKDILFFKNDSKLEIESIGWLFVLTNRYFFAALCNKEKRISTLFEYFPDNNTVKKIVSFNNGSIYNVELYDS